MLHHRKSKFWLHTHAWSIWLLSAAFMFYKYAIEVSPSVMTSTLMNAFSVNGTILGYFVASYFFAYMFLQIPAGVLLDRIGPRKITTAAIIICGLGSIIFSYAESIYFASLGRFFTGLGAAFAAVNCLKLTANWFLPKQFAFMAGLMMTLAMIGAVGGQAPLASFINSVGWRDAMFWLGWIGIILAAIFWAVVRDFPLDKREKHIVSQKISIIASVKEISKNNQCWVLSIYSGFAFAPVMVFGGLWGVPFTQEAFGVSHSVAAQAVSLIFIGFAVGAPIFGWFSDWIEARKPVMRWGLVAATITMSLIVYLPGFSYSLLMALLFLFGFFISSFLLCFTMIREISRNMIAATAIGFMNAFDALFGVVADPLTGFFLDLFWDGKMVDGARAYSLSAYKLAFLSQPLFLIVAIGSLYWIKETHCRSVEPAQLP